MIVEKLTADQLPPPVARRLNQATLIGSARLAALWRPLGGREVFWCATEKGQITLALAAVEFGRRPWKRLQAMPDGLYACPVATGESVDLRDAMCSVVTAIAKGGYAKVIVNDYYGLCGAPDGYLPFEGHTTVVDIAASDWQPPDSKIQSEIRKAEREGIAPRPFNAENDMPAFLELMQRTEVRHGRSPKYPAAFWGGLAELARADSRVRWMNIVHGGKLAASHIYFVEGEMLFHWQAFFDKEFSFLKPNQYLMFTMARQAARTGATMLNQGASPPDAEGLIDYKLKWGGQERRYRCLRRRSGLGRWL
jgi:hypothetical protein